MSAALSVENFKYILNSTDDSGLIRSSNTFTIDIDRPLPTITRLAYASEDYASMSLYKAILNIPGVVAVQFVLRYRIIVHKGAIFDRDEIINTVLGLIDLHYSDK